MTEAVSMPTASDKVHNPDILTCLANLSADEVFTPPKLASAMLDALPPALFEDPATTFLDPVAKSGVFLREIAKRLNRGLASQMPDDQKRIDHILTRQVFGLATGELTWLLARRSLYCSKKADGKFSICTKFATPEGHVHYRRVGHRWTAAGRCEDCGANRGEYDRDAAQEAYAYPFIHGVNPEEVFNVKFDVIVGNPPYQLSDGGFGRSAAPIYGQFVTQAKSLEPRFLTMVIPARWFAGGKGLGEFRAEMLGDRRLRKIVDYLHSQEAIPGPDIAGGLCYFLWDREYNGECEVINASAGENTSLMRKLDEFPTFVRSGKAVPIVKKVREYHGESANYLNKAISPSKPFGLRTFYVPKTDGTPCWFTQRQGLQFADPSDVVDALDILGRWKLLIPPAPIAGQTDFSKPIRFYYDENLRVARPGECCTESWLVAHTAGTEAEIERFKSYLLTKIVRFLLLQTVVSQHVTKTNFVFIPDLGIYDQSYTDEMLRERWNITDDEWAYIDSKIG